MINPTTHYSTHHSTALINPTIDCFFSSLIFHLYDDIPLMRICMYEDGALKYLEWVGKQIPLWSS